MFYHIHLFSRGAASGGCESDPGLFLAERLARAWKNDQVPANAAGFCV